MRDMKSARHVYDHAAAGRTAGLRNRLDSVLLEIRRSKSDSKFRRAGKALTATGAASWAFCRLPRGTLAIVAALRTGARNFRVQLTKLTEELLSKDAENVIAKVVAEARAGAVTGNSATCSS